MNIDTNTVVSISPGLRLQFEKAQDTWVLLYPEGMVKLNQSASEIMQRCDGKRKLSDVVELLEKDFEQTGLEPDVLSFVQHALEQKWVELRNE